MPEKSLLPVMDTYSRLHSSHSLPAAPPGQQQDNTNSINSMVQFGIFTNSSIEISRTSGQFIHLFVPAANGGASAVVCTRWHRNRTKVSNSRTVLELPPTAILFCFFDQTMISFVAGNKYACAANSNVVVQTTTLWGRRGHCYV